MSESQTNESSVQTQTPPQRPPIKMFIAAAEQFTQHGPEGITYDFNNGCRVEVPTLTNGEKWKIRFTDRETFNVVFEIETEGGSYRSVKVYYVPFKIEVWRGTHKVFEHDYDARNKPVQVQIPLGTLGDAIAWFPYADMFQKKHGCQMVCVMSPLITAMFKSEYPDIKFITPDEAEACQGDFYATYRVGLFFNDWGCTHQPADFRYVGLHKTAANILGVDPVEAPPKIHIPDTGRMIAEPYVCIAVQSSTQSKYWNNPHGWPEIVKFLKEAGYRVLCIDKEPCWGQGLTWTHIPHGVEDMTGPLPLPERAALLKHAEFFVGLSSGLAWLAWATGIPVVMISGFTHPNNEFHTPYRVFNHHACNSCWQDPRFMFDHYDFFWCPRHKDDNQQFECTKLITADQVKSIIRKIPGFLGANSDSLENKAMN